MKSNCYRTFSTRPSNFARPCIVSACTASLFLRLCSVAGADVSLSDLQPLFTDVDSISSDTHSIFKNTRYLQGTLDSINQQATTQSEYQRNLLLFLGGGVTPPTGSMPITTLLQEIATNTRNAGSAVDVLAGNPWWATNSAFGLTRTGYELAYPSENPNSPWSFSFPEFMSRWSSMLTLPVGTQNSKSWMSANWQNQFGYEWKADNFGGGSYTRAWPYTWHDWISDAMRSNWVLQASLAGTTDPPSAEDTAATSAVDDGDTSGTNVIPDMVVERMNVSGVEDVINLIDADAIGEMFSHKVSGIDPHFTVFPGGRYGDVTVPQVVGSLAIPEDVAEYLRTVSMWLWRLALFVGCFFIVRQEVAFWSTLGGSTSDA